MINNIPNEPIQNSPSISSGMKDKGSHHSKHPTRKATIRIKMREAVNPRSRALNDFAGRSLLYLRQTFRNSKIPITRTPKMNVMVRSRFISLSVRKLEKFGVWMVFRRYGIQRNPKGLSTPSRSRKTQKSRRKLQIQSSGGKR